MTKYYDLLTALYWIAFRNPKPSKKLIFENDDLLKKAQVLLYKYLTQEYNELCPEPKDIIATAGIQDKNTQSMTNVDITSFAPDIMVYFDDSMITSMENTYQGVCLLVDKLKDVFPPEKHLHDNDKRRENISHDIAFYCYETHKPLQALKLLQILETVLPEYDLKAPTQNTIKAWVTGFNDGLYTPINTKQQITLKHPRIFEKLKNAIRAI